MATKYQAEMLVRSWVQIPVSGENLEDALSVAKNLAYADVVKTKGETIDFQMDLIGVTQRNVSID